MNKIIQCHNLTHYYGKKCVYENLNFDVEEGRILGLLGKNGTGKSTTINIMNGFLKPYSGECLIYNENTQKLKSKTKKRIGFLIEGHVQYTFMNIHQIEKYYAGFYSNWNAEPYWELMSKLHVSPKQKIANMSCGQRSQVALGLILAQNPDLLILDDFSMGLDPGYRRLFIDYLRAYAKEKQKTIFTTSHIIQDMERLIDDILVIDNKQVLAQMPINTFMSNFKQFNFELENAQTTLKADECIVNIEQLKNHVEIFTYASKQTILNYLKTHGIAYKNFREVNMQLEDAFIGLTGKY